MAVTATTATTASRLSGSEAVVVPTGVSAAGVARNVLSSAQARGDKEIDAERPILPRVSSDIQDAVRAFCSEPYPRQTSVCIITSLESSEEFTLDNRPWCTFFPNTEMYLQIIARLVQYGQREAAAQIAQLLTDRGNCTDQIKKCLDENFDLEEFFSQHPVKTDFSQSLQFYQPAETLNTCFETLLSEAESPTSESLQEAETQLVMRLNAQLTIWQLQQRKEYAQADCRSTHAEAKYDMQIAQWVLRLCDAGHPAVARRFVDRMRHADARLYWLLEICSRFAPLSLSRVDEVATSTLAASST